MTDIKMSNQSELLGQFVAMGKLLFQECPISSKQTVYTKELLSTFLADVEKNLPLYLETLDELKKQRKTAKMEEILGELDKLYILISCQSFRHFQVEEAEFLHGYEEQLELFAIER